ncbi:MAG TPA: ThiF family adenylyltransferase [Isosphaeraceae bacterium]|nr:ThiF family adenylyltransferase [Isosphaeraceae bacterium]
MSEVLKIDPQGTEDRFARFELISWWDQERLAKARILLIGVGALGNEILKNCALLGVGNVFAADLDAVESSNLSRSVLFRAEDCGKAKVEAAARRAAEIYPGIKVQPFRGNIVYDLGLGVYRWADVIVGGLDNREARVAINQAAARVGKVWIDGAIERLDGVARVFDPATGPCYECTMGENDWKMLEARRSCALLSRDEMEHGKVPTTPTTASVIGGIQCQEAVKLIHGLEVLSGRGFVFDGTYHQSYLVQYSKKADCPAHDAFVPIEVLPWRVGETRVGDFLDRVRTDLGAEAVIETNQELLASLSCTKCQKVEPLLMSLGKVSEARGRCPNCGEHRTPKLYHTIDDRDVSLLDRSLGELGVPAWEILGGRAGLNQRYYEFSGDREAMLGVLA